LPIISSLLAQLSIQRYGLWISVLARLFIRLLVTKVRSYL
jgi:hypothetical protein